MNNQEPLVSVGLTTYERPEGLKRALKSITDQTYKNLEIIVSENYSISGQIKEIVQRFLKTDRRIKYFQHKPNKGARFNAEFVLEKATGKYFMWAADDDSWEPSFISELVRKLEKHPEAGVAMSGLKVFNQNAPPQAIRFRDQYDPNRKGIFGNFWAALHFPRSKYNLFICGLFRRQLLQEIHPQVADIYATDRILIIFLSLVVSFQSVNKILYLRDVWYTLSPKNKKVFYESNIVGWRGEISSIFKVSRTILFSKQILWYRKFYLPVGILVLIFRLQMHLLISFLGYVLIFFNWLIQKIAKWQNILVQRYIWSNK